MHAIETVLQTVVASDENTKQTIEYLKDQLFASSEIHSIDGEVPHNHRPDAVPLGAELSPLEFVYLFLNHIRAHAESVLAAAQAAWDLEQRKAQEVASTNTGRLPSEGTYTIPTQRRGAQNGQSKPCNDLQATAGQAAGSAAMLDLDSFPALGSSMATSAKNEKVQRTLPVPKPAAQYILQTPFPQPP